MDRSFLSEGWRMLFLVARVRFRPEFTFVFFSKIPAF